MLTASVVVGCLTEGRLVHWFCEPVQSVRSYFQKTKCPEPAGYDEQRDAPASSPGVAAGGAARFELPLAGAEAMGSRQGSQLPPLCILPQPCTKPRDPPPGRRADTSTRRAHAAPPAALKNWPERSCAGAVRAHEPHALAPRSAAPLTRPRSLSYHHHWRLELDRPLPTWQPRGTLLGARRLEYDG